MLIRNLSILGSVAKPGTTIRRTTCKTLRAVARVLGLPQAVKRAESLEETVPATVVGGYNKVHTKAELDPISAVLRSTTV